MGRHRLLHALQQQPAHADGITNAATPLSILHERPLCSTRPLQSTIPRKLLVHPARVATTGAGATLPDAGRDKLVFRHHVVRVRLLASSSSSSDPERDGDQSPSGPYALLGARRERGLRASIRPRPSRLPRLGRSALVATTTAMSALQSQPSDRTPPSDRLFG